MQSRRDVIHVSSHEEKNARIAELIAEQQAKTHTPAKLEAEREWLLQQEPGEENARASEDLERSGNDFEAAYRAFNDGDHDHVERFLQAVAPPPRDMVEALERRINDAFKQAAAASFKAVAAAPAAYGSLTAQRPRENRASRRARARASSSDDVPERPGRLDPELRLGLRREINRYVRRRLASMRECRICDRDLPLAEFRRARATCRDCEGEAQFERRHSEAIAA